jgi:tRNA threonylcarbamoyladenosine biosynthesis protein TsaB
MILGIDTATMTTAVTAGGVSQSFPEAPDQAERLMGEIISTLKLANADWADLKAVVALTGPGSFTGLRVGLAAAHGIAQARDIPLYGVAVVDAYNWTVPNDADQMLLLDSRRKDLAVAHRKAGEAAFGELTETAIETIEDSVANGTMQLCGNGIARLTENRITSARIACQWISIESVVKIWKSRVGSLDTCYRAINADPIYLRAPDVTISDKKFEHRTLYSA